MKALTVFTVSSLLLSACKKNTYSTDEPLVSSTTPSIFVSSQNKILYALDPATGKYKWEYNLKSVTVATPIVIGDFLYVPTLDTLFKFDVKKGTKLKAIALPNAFGYSVSPLPGYISSPVTDGKSLFIATRDSFLYSINPANDNINWRYAVNEPIHSSLSIFNGTVLVAGVNSIHTVNIIDGTLNWKVVSPGGTLESSPVVSAPYIYIGSSDFNLYALRVKDGSTAWSFKTAGIVNSSPIAYGGNVIFGSADNYVYCVDTAARTERWKFKTSDRVMSSPQAYGQVVYIGGYDSYLYALNIIDGAMKWRYKTGALIQSSAVAQQGSVYVGGYDKVLYKFDTSGTLKWTYNINGPIETSPILYDLNKTYYPSITGMYQY
jgi:outer membrane protein assembly factor BamB